MALVDKLASPPLSDLGDHLIPEGAALAYAEECIASGIGMQWSPAELAEALERAALFYIHGNSLVAQMKANPQNAKELSNVVSKAAADPLVARYAPPKLSDSAYKAAAAALKKPPKHRPRGLGDEAFIWGMAQIAEGCSLNVGTAEWGDGNDKGNPFRRFVLGWLKQIDPDRRHPPSRMIFRTAIKRFEESRAG